MTNLEIGIVCFINELHRRDIYRYEKYQLLHQVKYRKEMDAELVKRIREKYKNNCFVAAYELKTYYLENGILSNTIVLKMRPVTPDFQKLESIKIYSEADNAEREYTHHAIEIFKEHGKYKVFDVLHRDRAVWLEDYLDDVCKTNHCPRTQLRYDMGYLAPCHAFADNMQELSDLMRYLDKKYILGKPRMSLVNIPNEEEGCIISDDIIMDFDKFSREFGTDFETVKRVWTKVYGELMGIRFNTLHLLCLGHIMRDPIIKLSMAEALFDDIKMCQMMEKMQ